MLTRRAALGSLVALPALLAEACSRRETAGAPADAHDAGPRGPDAVARRCRAASRRDAARDVDAPRARAEWGGGDSSPGCHGRGCGCGCGYGGGGCGSRGTVAPRRRASRSRRSAEGAARRRAGVGARLRARPRDLAREQPADRRGRRRRVRRCGAARFVQPPARGPPVRRPRRPVSVRPRHQPSKQRRPRRLRPVPRGGARSAREA